MIWKLPRFWFSLIVDLCPYKICMIYNLLTNDNLGICNSIELGMITL